MVFDYDENADRKSFIDKKEILKYLKEEDIFELVFGFKPKMFEYITSPFRVDTNPGCWFQYNTSKKLVFIDFGTESYTNGVKNISMDCFTAVQIFFNLSNFYEVLYFIKSKLITKDSLIIKREIYSGEPSAKNVSQIFIETRDFHSGDKIFWQKYGISRQNLIADKVFPIRGYKVENSCKKDFSTRTYDVCYAYTDFEDNRKKIYRPYEVGKNKFVNNCNQNDIGGIKHLINSDTLIISKSYKDYRVLKNQGLNVVWFQNEGMIPKFDYLYNLCIQYQKIIVFFDNDRAGIVASLKVEERINSFFPKKASNIYLPEYLLKDEIKDPSDLIAKKSIKELIEFLTVKNVI